MNGKTFSLKDRPHIFRDILIVLVVFCVALMTFLFFISNLNPTDTNIAFHQRLEVLNKDWHITLSDGSLDDVVTLPYWVDADAGETITLTHTLPDMDDSHMAIVTNNYHQKMFAYLDDNLVYEFPRGAQKMSSIVITDDWNMIYTPEEYANHTVKIVFSVGIAPFNGYIKPIIFGEDNAIMASLQRQYRLPYGLALSIMIIGFFLVIIATIYARNFADKHSFILGFVFIAIGLWFTDRSKFPAFMVGSNMKFFVSFSALMLVPLLLSLYSGERFKMHNQTVPNIFMFLSIAMGLVLFGITAAKIMPIHAIIQYAYLASAVVILYTVYQLWYYSFGSGKRKINHVQLNAMRLEFFAAIATVIGSVLSIILDAINTGNFSSSQREWSGIGNVQMFAVVFFAFAQLVILLYKSYYSVLESESVQKQLHDSQLQLMMGQIQPHFMFNTLSSIRTLIKVDPDTAYNMVYDFSNYLRANVDNLTNLNNILFASEISHIQSYVGIEKVRFGERLNVEYDIQEDKFNVPPLSIQPLVENAIKHGVCKRPTGGTVWIRSYEEPKNYVVEVQDNGVGIPPERMAFIMGEDVEADHTFSNIHLSGNGSEVHTSTGMRNIRLRLKEMSNATLEVTSEVDKGTLIRVIFPKQ